MSASDGYAPDDQLLRRYLLGSAPPEEIERLDEASVADDDVAARLDRIENDLIDEYVGGELSPDVLQQFRARVLTTPRGRQKVAFAEALRTHRGRPSLGAFRWALAAAAVLFVAVSSYLFYENLRAIRPQPHQQSASAPARPAAVPPSASAPAVSPQPLPVMEAVTLLPLRRGAAETARVEVPGGVDSVRLNLRLEMDEFPRYRAVLKSSSGGAALWQSDPTAAEPSGNRRMVPLTIPAPAVRNGDYRVELEGLPARGAAENVGSYAFRAVIQ